MSEKDNNVNLMAQHSENAEQKISIAQAHIGDEKENFSDCVRSPPLSDEVADQPTAEETGGCHTTLPDFITAIREQSHFDSESGDIASAQGVRIFTDGNGKILKTQTSSFLAFRPRKSNVTENEQEEHSGVLFVLSNDLKYAVNGEAFTAGDGWDELIFEDEESWKRVISSRRCSTTAESGDNDFIEITTGPCVPIVTERCSSLTVSQDSVAEIRQIFSDPNSEQCVWATYSDQNAGGWWSLYLYVFVQEGSGGVTVFWAKNAALKDFPGIAPRAGGRLSFIDGDVLHHYRTLPLTVDGNCYAYEDEENSIVRITALHEFSRFLSKSERENFHSAGKKRCPDSLAKEEKR